MGLLKKISEWREKQSEEKYKKLLQEREKLQKREKLEALRAEVEKRKLDIKRRKLRLMREKRNLMEQKSQRFGSYVPDNSLERLFSGGQKKAPLDNLFSTPSKNIIPSLFGPAQKRKRRR